jgi:hypothetical protein
MKQPSNKPEYNPIVLKAVKTFSPRKDKLGFVTEPKTKVVSLKLDTVMGYVTEYWFVKKKRVNVNGDFQKVAAKQVAKTLKEATFRKYLKDHYGLTKIRRVKK